MKMHALRTGACCLWALVLVPSCTRSKRIEGLNRPVTPAPRIAPRADGRFTRADLERHVRAMKSRIPSGFSVVLEPPFVVLGDESPTRVRQRALNTVRWATTKLRALYFSKDPKRIIEVWLFKDRDSYRKHAKKLWNDEPSTPFGYYSDSNGVLVMNIATGGGTLVHEMVHPFVESNFPDAPAWLNEGLGSLYEQCGDRSGRIWGYTNWRLAGLQQAIRKGVVPTLKKLTATTTHQFYEKDPGTNYAQARYLLYYLQSKSQLVPFYKLFLKNRKTDPSGYASLQQILGKPNMVTFQKTWEQYVLGLKFN